MSKHWHECWRYTSHHACAVAEVERLRRELEEVKQDNAIITSSCPDCGTSYRRFARESNQHRCTGCGKVIVSREEAAVRGALGEEMSL